MNLTFCCRRSTVLYLLLLSTLNFWACKPLPPDQANYAQALKAYQAGNYDRALDYLQPLVDKGHPASQLLLAKMYLNGQGVAQDTSKAQMLRSLAALRMVANGLTPDERKAAAPEETMDPAALDQLAQQMQSLLPNSLGRESQTSPATVEVSAPPSLVPSSSSISTPEAPVIPENTRYANAISLSLLRRNADHGDPLAMQLLAVAYRHGFYGLPVNRDLAARWSERAGYARARHGASEEETGDQRPWGHFAWVIGVGLFFIGLGIWQAIRARGKS